MYKRQPLAAGDAPLSLGLALIPLLALAAVGLAAGVELRLGALVVAVLAVETLRLFRLRRWLATDVVALTWLALARLAAGTLVVGGTLTTGLAMFITLALAAVAAAERRPPAPGRGQSLLAHGCGLAGTALLWFVATPGAALAFQKPELLLLLWPALPMWIIRALKTAATHPNQPATRDPLRWLFAVAGASVLWLAVHG